MQPPGSSARFLLLLGASLAALGAPASADGPKGGAVAGGKAAISQSASRTVIRQRSNRAVIDWKGFDVSRDHRVVFDQPGKASATLNRVNSARRSVIEGALEAPGTVILQNRAGVIFTRTARIDAGGMVAASQDVDAARFRRDGRLVIGGGDRPGSRIINEGRITVRDAGLAALVGADVENAGAIVAERGTAALASGKRTTIDFAGDGLIRIAVEGDAPGGAGVANRGLIDVGGGRVVLSAGAAADALDAAINTTGVIRAASASGDGGRVELTARGAGAVRIAGAIDVSGARRGGALTATGAGIAVARPARIDARGGVDGGDVRLGGDRQGRGPLRRADHLRLDAGASIAADGATGRGGEVVLWSDGATLFDGAISATGPVSGGFVETSGRYALDVGANGSVAVGAGGEWLLDPRDVSIGTGGLTPVPPVATAPPPGATVYNVNRLAVISTLNAGGDVTISTVQPSSTMAGDITVAGPIAWTGGGSLRLEAERDINIAAGVTSADGDFTAVAARDIRTSGAIAMTGAGDFTLDAGRSVIVNQNVRATGSGGIAMRAGAGPVLLTELRAGNLIVSTETGPLSLSSRDDAVELRRIDPAAGSNIQVYSASGPVDLAAGTRILLEGGDQGGRWVRLGQLGSSADVTLTAPRVKVRGGDVGNTFAEVVTGPGGSLTVTASERIWVLNGAGDQGRIQTAGGSPLTLLGETQSWDGPVRAGNGASNGGEVVVAGAITASFQPQFSLAPDAGFTMRPAAPGGTPSSYLSTQPFVVTTSRAGAIEIGAPVTAQQITLESEERVGLGPSGRLEATGGGDALVVAAGRRLRNDATAGPAALAVTDPAARWLLYLDAFAGLTGPAPAPRAFDLYGRGYQDTPPSLLGFDGDRIVYAERPTLTLTAETLSKTYGTVAAPGYSVTGLRTGDSLATALVAGPTASSAGAQAAANVGTYATIAAATASDQGYVLDLAEGALTVTPAALTVAADDTSRTYGAANPTLTAGVTGFVLGQDLSDLGGTLSLATPATEASDVGDYAITASGLTSANYAIAYEGGSLAVTPAALTVAADDKSRTYGAANPTLTAGVTGFVLGEDLSDLGGTLTLATPATRSSDVGGYAITGSGLTSRNYAIAYADGALTIDPARLVVTPGGTRTYGSLVTDFETDVAGFVLGQDLSDLDGALSYATPAAIDSNAGAYGLTASGLSSTNYALTYQAGTLTIDPARLTVAATDKSRVYGAANPRLTASVTGFVLGQSLADLGGALALATPATAASDVGAYAITASGLTSGNYTIAYANGALAVTPAALTVAATDKARTYGAANPRLTADVTGFVLGQTLADLDGALALATPATRASDVGTYAITASGLTSGNYAITFADGALTIDPARLVVRPGGTRTYGSLATDFDTDVTGFVLGQGLADLGGALTYATPATLDSNAGTYGLTASGLTSGNYAIAYADGALTIDPARLTVRANDAERPAGRANPRFTASYRGFVLGQDAGSLDGALILTTEATRDSPPGGYAITGAGLTSGNYAITYANGLLTVRPAPQPPNPNPNPNPGFPIASLDQSIETFGRGAPPFTPGDSAFRTTNAEAPTAIDSTFALTYSLGEIVQLAPPDTADTGGFTPAAGGGGDAQPAAASCSGPIAPATPQSACVLQTAPESFWTTTFPGESR